MNRVQRQAWIENWTIWTLMGMIGALSNIIKQASRNKLCVNSLLYSLISTMKQVIDDTKEEQQWRRLDRQKLKQEKEL